jgi:hypothetical protein
MVTTQLLPTQPLVFQPPASTVRVELWRGGNQWSLAYLGLTTIGLEVVDDDLVEWDRAADDTAAAELVEVRLRAFGLRPMRTRCDLAPPVVAAWKV